MEKSRNRLWHNRKSNWKRNIGEYIYHNGRDIISSSNFKKTRNHIQHGSKTVHEHCYDVAGYSLWMNRKFRLNCKERDLVRGALLHDYFLYDWHDKGHERLHGFHHPDIALINAGKEYELSFREMDIIKKHMWPMTVIPPVCREAWVVTTADKYCSLLETLHIHRGNTSAKTIRRIN